MSTEPSLTRKLARLIDEKPIQQSDRETAALFVLDLVANAIGGQTEDVGAMITKWVNASGRDLGRQAFVMGALGHTLEMDDLHRTSVVHPGCVVIPAAWAMACARAANGHDLLDAVIRGFESACRIGATVGPQHYKIWHNTATCGPFGAAQAVASLMGLDEDETVNALGNAGTQSSGLWEFLPAGAMSKHLHAGRASESGLIAAQLASLGFTGPDSILEGDQGFYRALCPDPQPGGLLQNADGPWELVQTSMKPWPSCRHTHPAIDAANDLVAGFDLDETDLIEVETYAAALNVCNRPAPQTEYDAKFSLQHCVATALTTKEIGFSAFSAAARADVAPVAQRVQLAIGEPYEIAYPNTWGAAVTICRKDGEKIRARRTFAKGDPQDPLSVEEVIAKSDMLIRYGGVENPQPIIHGILALANNAPLPELPLPLFRTE